MKSRTHCLLAVFAICLAFSQARGQEGQPGYRPPGTPGATGPENKYVELSHSKDRVIKATAERYLNLVKFQEWGGASGKTQIAKYVSHDPDLKRVKLSVAKGTGKDRVLKEFDVEVEKLSKTSQARVKQIDVLQKRLDELAAAAAKSDGTGRLGGPEGPDAPVASERGAHPRNGQGPEGADAGPGSPPVSPAAAPPQAAGPEVDPSASEPDPLGFAELPPNVPASPASFGPGPGPTGSTPGAATPQGPGNVLPEGAPSPTTPDNAAPIRSDSVKPWQTDFEAFRGNFKVYPVGPGQPAAPSDRKLVRVWEGSPMQHTAEWDVDFGELDDLRLIAESLEVVSSNPRSSLSRPDFQQKFKDSDDAKKRVGEVMWEATFRKFNGATQPIELIFPALPKPLQITSMLDPEASTPDQWSSFARGDRIRFKARLSMSNSDDIRLNVREPVKVGSSTTPIP